MSRHGYIEDDYYDNNSVLYWGRVARSLSGKRGQKALLDLVVALDAMETKELADGVFNRDCGMCALGVLAKARNVDLSSVEPEEAGDPVDEKALGALLDISPSMAREVMYVNDEEASSPSGRWAAVRQWAYDKLNKENKATLLRTRQGEESQWFRISKSEETFTVVFENDGSISVTVEDYACDADGWSQTSLSREEMVQLRDWLNEKLKGEGE